MSKQNSRSKNHNKSKQSTPLSRLNYIENKSDKEIVEVRVVCFPTPVSASITGILAQTALSIGSFTENQWAALYDEYRILGGKIHWVGVPNASNSAFQPVYVTFDNDNVPAYISNAAASEVNNVKLLPSTSARSERWTYEFQRPTGGGNTAIQWCDTSGAAPVSLGALTIFTATSFGGTFNPVAQYYVELLVQFRGRK